jgi:hypothetical protein
MIVLYQLRNGRRVRQCDSRCYNGEIHVECHCICGGQNHGVGLEQAVNNMLQFANAGLAQGPLYVPERELLQVPSRPLPMLWGRTGVYHS